MSEVVERVAIKALEKFADETRQIAKHSRENQHLWHEVTIAEDTAKDLRSGRLSIASSECFPEAIKITAK